MYRRKFVDELKQPECRQLRSKSGPHRTWYIDKNFCVSNFPSTCLSEVKTRKMTRGNQRELARAKNMKKAAKKAAGEQDSNKGLTLEQRKQRDADRMREKQMKKAGDEQNNAKQGAQ